MEFFPKLGSRCVWSVATSIFVGCGSLGAAHADSGTFKGGLLSVFEKPLAYEVGDVTFQLRGSLDEAAHADIRTDKITARTTADFEFSAETQLRNQLTVGAAYSGQFKTHPGSITGVGGGGSSDKYGDSVSAFVSGVWGRVSGGNVTGLVADETQRKGQVGNAALAFENGFGGLNEWGGGYRGRFGPAVVSAAIDDELNADFGLRLSRPIGNKDLGFSVRGTMGAFVSQDKSTTFDTHSLIVKADMIYGSSLIDASVGFERLSSTSVDADRLHASFGVQHKVGALTVSANGHLGVLEGNTERSIALGGRYDIARGLSANLGLNYAMLEANVDNVEIVAKDDMEAVLSLRYDF